LYESIKQGSLNISDDATQFFVLGLAPNAARISIRFWLTGTVKEFSQRIVEHFSDIAIDHAPYDPPHLSLFRLLASTALQGKAENIPPNLGGDTMRAILSGLPYPETLLSSAIRRIRAEHEVNYQRAALIKACINRKMRRENPAIEEDLKVSLDPANTNTGYRLGRLFATLEKVQEEASPGLNATIRDRYYGAASSTPVTVFSTLLKLKNHHLSKLENRGRAVNLERLIGEIADGITDFPANLTIADQGRFAIGYYHQKQAFYARKSEIAEGEQA
jgi:CRISPR-associated protein Csd1